MKTGLNQETIKVFKSIKQGNGILSLAAPHITQLRKIDLITNYLI